MGIAKADKASARQLCGLALDGRWVVWIVWIGVKLAWFCVDVHTKGTMYLEMYLHTNTSTDVYIRCAQDRIRNGCPTQRDQWDQEATPNSH